MTGKQNLVHPHLSNLFLISLLGALSILSPFSIDMYLPAFQKVAGDFSVASATISLTLSSYFIGLSLGQIFYGPLLDRFGRKPPLYFGIALFILASLGCGLAPNIYALIAFRFLQALGGCVAQVAALAMVRDFFPAQDCAKILSRLFLFIAASPLLAPSIGGMIMMAVSWRAVFAILAGIAAMIVALIYFFLPEGHKPDTSISLKPIPIMREYLTIACHPRFITYALSGAFSLGGLFAYVAGSPIIFMEGFHLGVQAYSAVFALLVTGFIGGSQLNVWLLKTFSSEALFLRVLLLQVGCGILFVTGAGAGWWDLYSTLLIFFLFLSCAGITYPNAAAIAMAPFTKNAGSAAAMLGFLQLGVGSIIACSISVVTTHETFPIIVMLAMTSIMGLVILLMGRKRALICAAIE